MKYEGEAMTEDEKHTAVVFACIAISVGIMFAAQIVLWLDRIGVI